MFSSSGFFFLFLGKVLSWKTEFKQKTKDFWQGGHRDSQGVQGRVLVNKNTEGRVLVNKNTEKL